jgi:hypothetical protein
LFIDESTAVFGWFLFHFTYFSLFFYSCGAKGIHEAVEGDFLDFHSLPLLNPYMVSVLHSDLCIIQAEPRQLFLLQPNLSASWLFHRAMSVRPQISVSPTFVNELLFANFQSMQVT